MSRDPAMLTPDQREYLRGEKDYNTDVENNTRYAIRKRVRNTLFDFGLLLEEMDARDRKQIFKDIRPASLREDEDYSDEEFREDELGGLVRTLAFLYLGADELGIPFENAIEQGIFAARGTDADDPFVAQTVEVDIEEELGTDIDKVFEKIERGEQLTEVEYFGASRLVLTDLRKFIRHGTRIDLDATSLLDTSEELSRGESLVVVARSLDEPDGFDDYDLYELLHDDVITHLGLSNVMQPEVEDPDD